MAWIIGMHEELLDLMGVCIKQDILGQKYEKFKKICYKNVRT